MKVSAPSFAATLKLVEREAARTASEQADGTGISAQDFVRAAAESRKEFARERVKALREQITTLSLFAMKPAALAQLSSQMGKELEGAATDFARSVRTLGDARRGTSPGTPAEAYQDTMETAAPAPYRLSDSDRETAASFTAAARQIEMLTDNALERTRDRSITEQAKAARADAFGVIALMDRLEGKGLLEPLVH